MGRHLRNSPQPLDLAPVLRVPGHIAGGEERIFCEIARKIIPVIPGLTGNLAFRASVARRGIYEITDYGGL